MSHRYTLGVAGERFFKALRDERLILTSPCPKCQDRLLPARMYCERCFEETGDDWTPVVGPGFVQSFTVLHYDLEDAAFGPPPNRGPRDLAGRPGRDHSPAVRHRLR